MWTTIVFIALLPALQNAISTPANAPPTVKLDLQMDIALLLDWNEYDHVVKEAQKFIDFLMVGESQVHVGAWVVGDNTSSIFPLTGDHNAIDTGFKTFKKPTSTLAVYLSRGLESAKKGFDTSGRPGVHKAIYYFFGNQTLVDALTTKTSWDTFKASGGTFVTCSFGELEKQKQEVIKGVAPSYSCTYQHYASMDLNATTKELQQHFNRLVCGDTNGTCVFKSTGGGCVELPWRTNITVDRLQCLQVPELKTCEAEKCNGFCDSFFEDKEKTCKGKCATQNRTRIQNPAQWLEEVVKLCQKEVQCEQCTPSEGGLATWAIVVIVVVCLLMLIAVIIVVIVMNRRKQKVAIASPWKAAQPVEGKSARAIVGDDRTVRKGEQSVGVSLKLETTEKQPKSIKGASGLSKVGQLTKKFSVQKKA